MSQRQEQKARTRERLLTAAADRLRKHGPDSTGVADVMADAGLTHGGFYAHFPDKAALIDAAFHHAMTDSREAFFGGLDGVDGAPRRRWLAGRYLSARHRDQPEEGCALASLAGDAGRGGNDMRQRFTAELRRSLARFSPGDTADFDDADLAFFAMCIGGILTARAVDDPDLSERILRACRQLAPQFAGRDEPESKDDNMDPAEGAAGQEAKS